jgi:serine/threonine protein kinase
MNFGQTVAGQQSKWSLVEKLGEGDAGEVYLVESLLGGRPAILKRPRRSSFSSDTLRQAAQIRTEGLILKALHGISLSRQGAPLTTPELLDQSLAEAGIGEGFFIVIERAAGFDLKTLRQIVHFGLVDELNISTSEENRFFIEKLAKSTEIPEPILIRLLLSILDMLDTIHNTEVWNERTKQYGVMWNDVKPEHMYWDPVRARLIVIDWGNGQFLEVDGATKDRQHSCIDDYYQFIQEMGAFLAESNPDLHARLKWPEEVTPGIAYSEGVKPLKERLGALHVEVLKQLQDLRFQESSLYGTSRPKIEHLTQSDDLQRRFLDFGEMPDFSSAVNFHARVALQMASENDLEAFQLVCESTAKLATSYSEKWELLEEIARIAIQEGAGEEEKVGQAFSNALAAGVADDWTTLLWEIFTWIGKDPLPDWWDTLSQGVRRVHLRLDGDAINPCIAVSRLFYTLQATILQLGDNLPASSPEDGGASEDKLRDHEDLLKIFNEEVVKKWKAIEPPPPNSGIGYQDIDGLMDEVEVILPETQEKLEKVLLQPKAQAEIVLNAWERRDFETARRGLRTLLLWDPDRRRLLQADKAIASASRWLSQVRRGAETDEPFYDFLTAVELTGRNLRNQVGAANWLDMTLDALKRLRKGTRPADLMMELPEISNEIPWLNEYRSRESLSLPHTRPLNLERDETFSTPARNVVGVVEGRLGSDQDLLLAEPLDTWAPEARGSSARVFAGYLRNQANSRVLVAVKVMRPDRVEYALPLFRDEAQILTMLRDVPGITPLVECGFLRIEAGLEFPSEEGQATANHLQGEVVRYGVDEVQNFLASMGRYLAGGWLPYLAMVKRNQEHNLMVYCDAGRTHGWFLPLREGLLLGIQICDILQSAHDRNIVYRDHKILHYYWDPESHGVVMIDWNIAKRHAQGLSEAERQFDLVQFGARALHHILTGRPAPGALPLGPNRPEEIEHASLSYAVNWTYDDERLPNQVKEILEQVLNQGYTHIRDLRKDLVQIYEQMPDPAQVQDKP